jgi:hypothetical protein
MSKKVFGRKAREIISPAFTTQTTRRNYAPVNITQNCYLVKMFNKKFLSTIAIFIY